MADEENPIAQGQQESTETQTEQRSGVSPVLQSRIDEIVAQREEFRREAVAARESNAEMMREFIKLQKGSAPEARDPVLEDIDPGDRTKFEAMFRHYGQQQLAPILQRLDQIAGLAHTTRAQSVLQNIDDPDIRREAAGLIEGFKRAGYLTNGTATEEDAILLAKGRAYDRLKKEIEHRNFNNGEPPLSGGRAAPSSNGKKPKFDLKNMTHDQIVANMSAVEQEMGDFEI